MIRSLRWYVKKGARAGMAIAAWGSGALAARRALWPGPRVRALTYHRFGREAREAFCVSPRAFEEQISWLARDRRAVSLEDVREFVNGRRSLADGSLLVTIDDGFASMMDVALPVLARHGVPAVAFVSSGLVGHGVPGRDRYLDWSELRACASAGIAIGSHAHSHRSLGRMSRLEAREEVHRSKETIEDKLGREVASFAYPYGVHGDHDVETKRALREAGYSIAFHSQHGSIRPRADALGLPRVKVEGGEERWMFELLARGAMDPWRYVDERVAPLWTDRAPADAVT
jgi:peptidoglycan/xylan/chitin deacetylase (PgdA/CDA1 family)